jgi:hypothetical protein
VGSQVDSSAVAKEELSRTTVELQRVGANYAAISSEYNDMQRRLNDYSSDNSMLRHQVAIAP